MDRSSKYNGFTLIEIVIVIGIITLAVGFIFPLTISQIRENKLYSASEEVSGAIFEAQQYAYSRKNGLGYGIQFEGNEYRFLSGGSYATAAIDDTFTLENGITITTSNFAAADDIFFSPGNIRPDAAGSLIISDGSKTIEITVNSEGAIFVND